MIIIRSRFHGIGPEVTRLEDLPQLEQERIRRNRESIDDQVESRRAKEEREERQRDPLLRFIDSL